MTRIDRHLGEILTQLPHRLHQVRQRRITNPIPLRVDKQRRKAQPSPIRRRLGILPISLMVQIIRIRTLKPVPLKLRHQPGKPLPVARKQRSLKRQPGRRRRRPAPPPARLAHKRQPRRLPVRLGPTSAIQRLQRGGHVGAQLRRAGGGLLDVVRLVLELGERELGGRVDIAISQGDRAVEPVLEHAVGHGEEGGAGAEVGPLGREG